MTTYRPTETWKNQNQGSYSGFTPKAESCPYFLRKQNRNVSALKHVHDTDLFFLTTVKRTSLELVPNLAELLPSLVY